MAQLSELRQIKRIHALLSELNMKRDKDTVVEGATNGRTSSTREMTYDEAQALIDGLEKLAAPVRQPKPTQSRTYMMDKKRKCVIANLCQAGYITKSGKPDMQRIEEWVMKQKHKKRLNDHNYRELSDLITAAEGVRKHFYEATRKVKS